MTTLPISVVARAVPFINGDNDTSLAVPEVVPPKVVLLPDTVIMPAAVTDPDMTYFVGVNEQLVERSRAVLSELCTASVIVVRQDEAARITSEAFARTV